MTIKKEVLEDIFAISNQFGFETGGILGSSGKGIITDIVSDLPDKTQMYKFEYYPNILFLNEEIEKWARKNIEFLGVFHTHFSSSCILSEPDKTYIKSIMQNAFEIVDYLYFPIFTLPDNELFVYKAYFINKKVVIEEDELFVI